jgi:hypothetical protein
LLEVTEALVESGLRFLIMGGHALRHYGVDRNTFDFDFHVSGQEAAGLAERLRATRLFARGQLVEGPSWRATDFRRYQIGVQPNGREEWLEFWFRNHLLAPFPEAYQRREEAHIEGRTLSFLALSDLIRSKETERDDDWTDVRLLEEILDNRNLARVGDAASRVIALSQLRSRRGFERAEHDGLLADRGAVAGAFSAAQHPVTLAYLFPFVGPDTVSTRELPLDIAVRAALKQIQCGGPRHLAIVEAVRLAYQRAARAADQADKQRIRNAP